MRARGYNQSALVAKEAAQLLKLPYRVILEKYKENRIQHELDRRNRAKNVRGVYRFLPGEEITGKRILLIDDIMTTGATLQECADVLLCHGAASVLCAVIAVVQ
nr:phosphoribosyltransferase family protein [Clostridium sp. D33t1_170424_F3]